MESLKKLDRKFLIFIGCLILIPILLILFLVVAQGCSNKKTSYSKYEFKMKTAAKKYLSEIDNLPTEVGEYRFVDLDTLVEQSYISSPKKSIGDATCDGYVGVRKTDKVNYVAVLNCDDYKTGTLVENLKKDLTETSNGLYKTDSGYVFKGDKVNNYIKLNDIEYRIIGITDTNAVKLYKVDSESMQNRWDNKYNVNTNAGTGINIYKDSLILEKLNKLYQTNAKIKKIKKYLVSIDECVYSKNVNDRFLNKNECHETIENQYISLLSIDDFMNASLDPNCVDLYSKSCRNYNYLGKNGVYTWTKDVAGDNNYQAYYMANGILYAEDANTYEDYNLVIYVDGDVLVKSGNGTQKSPYQVK